MNPLRLGMRGLSLLPLPVIRFVGRLTGNLFYGVSTRRRNVVLANLKACFPQWDETTRRRMALKHFVVLGQSLWDRAWLWHAPEKVVQQRLVFRGDFSVFDDPSPLIVLAPHFVGLDAGGLAMTYVRRVPMAFVFVPLRNRWVEDWVMRGRNRSGLVRSVPRNDGPTPLLQALKDGLRLHYSPDMDFGMQGAAWVDFFGVSAATTCSMSRLAKLANARVCVLVSRLTPTGYEVAVGPVWPSYPSGNLTADALTMNQAIETQVMQSIEQYYWVHKRFKTQPAGSPPIYDH